jgi:N-acetylglucosamine-6-phosphate deacetylase
MITLAPERPRGLELIERLVDAGVLVAIGHTDATYAVTRAAIDAGARVGTHLFNGMRPIHHREPGPALALLEDPRVTVEMIADGLHLHPAVEHHILGTAGPDRVATVTDAMAAAGMGDGVYRLGRRAVQVVDGEACLEGTRTLAGSTTTMEASFRRLVRLLEDRGTEEALAAAVEVTATTPARTLGLADRGSLEAGRRADLVLLDSELDVIAVMRRGRWLVGAGAG